MVRKHDESNHYECYRCGSSNHLASYKHCPALGKECRKCGKKDHFSKVCRANFQTKKVFAVRGEDSEDAEIEESLEDLVLLVAILDKCYDQDQPKCTVLVNKHDVTVLVDTGSRITIISKDSYENLPRKNKLQASRITPGAYGGHKIALEGVFMAELSFCGRTTSAKVYVVDQGIDILGWKEQQNLRMMINPCKAPYVFSISNNDLDEVLEEYRSVFSKDLGLLKGYQHSIKLKDHAMPVRQKVRNIPLSARKDVEDVLKKWLDEGVIETVAASPWLSPVVVAKKKMAR